MSLESSLLEFLLPLYNCHRHWFGQHRRRDYRTIRYLQILHMGVYCSWFLFSMCIWVSFGIDLKRLVNYVVAFFWSPNFPFWPTSMPEPWGLPESIGMSFECSVFFQGCQTSQFGMVSIVHHRCLCLPVWSLLVRLAFHWLLIISIAIVPCPHCLAVIKILCLHSARFSRPRET